MKSAKQERAAALCSGLSCIKSRVDTRSVPVWREETGSDG